jgi:hypothetical protein
MNFFFHLILNFSIFDQLVSTARTGLQAGQSLQDFQDRTPRSGARACGTQQIGQDKENITTKTGQLEHKRWGQEYCGRTAENGKPGQDTAREDSQDGTARTGKRDNMART